MADDEREESGPSLELPSIGSALGLGRKRRGRKVADPAPEVAGLTAPEPEEAPGEPVSGPRPVHEPDTPPPVPVPDPTPADPTPAPNPAPAPDPASAPHPAPRRVPVPSAEGSPAPDLAATTVLVAEPEPEPVPEGGARKGTPRRLRVPRPQVPALRVHGLIAAVVTGALVGLGLVGLTVASLHLCSALRGTSSCGKPGVFLLFAITVAMVFLGALLLRLARAESPGSTSFLGVGLLVALILLLLLPAIFSWWMVIVIPALGMVTYGASWWLTSNFTEPGDGMR